MENQSFNFPQAAPGGLNRAAIGRVHNAGTEKIDRVHTEAYAKATNDDNPRYLDGDDVVAPLLFAVRPLLGVCGMAVIDPELNADLMRLVHGEQEMRYFGSLSPGDTISTRSEVAEIVDKTSGQLLKIRQQLLKDDTVICEAISGYFIRGRGPKGARSAPEQPPPRTFLYEAPVVMDADQSLRYAEASLDRNPIHVSDEIAQMAGHPGVICHGLCTLAMSARELVNRLAGGDAAGFTRLRVRFTKIVLPGQALTTRAWIESEHDDHITVGFETANADGALVLGQGEADITRTHWSQA